jgi:glycosyltransferase involved in cell wall biosynthesis
VLNAENRGAKAKWVWFCSSVGGGVFGSNQTAAWRALGIEARLHCAVEPAAYWRAKSGMLARLRLRWKMYASYPLRLRRMVRRAGPAEIFVAITNPFFLPALAARAARHNGARVVHLVYDLYPDALVFGGGWSWRNPAARFAARTTRAAIAQCSATVYLGERLRAYAEARYGVAPRTAVIAVGTDASVFLGCDPAARGRRAVRCLYSGHMGHLHDWQTLGDAMAAGVPDDLELEIASEGPGATALKWRLALVAARNPERLAFSGTRGDAEWRTAMLSADVALVTMRPGAEKVVMPSKTYSAMAAGQAILAVCPRESDLADLIAVHDCGWVIEPGDAAGLKKRLAALPEASEEILGKRRNAWKAAQAHYSMDVVGKKWRELFESIDAN